MIKQKPLEMKQINLHDKEIDLIIQALTLAVSVSANYEQNDYKYALLNSLRARFLGLQDMYNVRHNDDKED
jgi:hypothetical protein